MSRYKRTRDDYRKLLHGLRRIESELGSVRRVAARMFGSTSREWKAVDSLWWKLAPSRVRVETAALEENKWPTDSRPSRDEELLADADVTEPGMFGGAP